MVVIKNMSDSTVSELLSLQKRLTSFRNEEGYITFYFEYEYTASGKPRNLMTPKGSSIFTRGFTLNETRQALDPQQAFGFNYPNLRPVGSADASFSIQGYYTQEKSLDWLFPGHPPFVIFIDFIDDSTTRLHNSQPSNIYQAGSTAYTQTFLVRDCRCISKNVVAADDSLVQWDLSFTCGEVVALSPGVNGFNTNDYVSPVIEQNVHLPVVAGFGNNFGTNFGK